MEKFTASNGVVIEDNFNGDKDYWNITGPRGGIAVNQGEQDALREFFRHERDEELGRWRWPENPDYVVYPDEDGCISTMHEPTGVERGSFSRDGVEGIPAVNHSGLAARAYFAAHPESKPWHDAKRDDVWKFVTRDDTRHALARRSTDDWDVMTPHGTAITAVDDPVTALVDGGFPEFAMLESAKKWTEASNA